MEGRKLAPLGWYEPDTRGNYDVGEGWQWGRLTTTPNGIHYISHDTSKPGPRILVDPDIAQWIGYSEVAGDDTYLNDPSFRHFAATMEGMDREMMMPITYPYGATDINAVITFAASTHGLSLDQLRNGDWGPVNPFRDPRFDVPFRVPDPKAGGGWVAVFASQVHASPYARGPYANIGNGPFRVLWVNGYGKWGYSSHPENTPEDLYSLGGSLSKLRATIRPIASFESFEMPPQKVFDNVLRSNAEEGWDMDRMVALARGDITVENPAFDYWSEEGLPEE